MQMDYRFELLSVENSRKLAKSLQHSETDINNITEPMSLADIYNMKKTVQFCKLKEEKRMGF